MEVFEAGSEDLGCVIDTAAKSLERDAEAAGELRSRLARVRRTGTLSHSSASACTPVALDTAIVAIRAHLTMAPGTSMKICMCTWRGQSSLNVVSPCLAFFRVLFSALHVKPEA